MKFFPYTKEKQKTLGSCICLGVLSLGSIYCFAIGSIVMGVFILFATLLPAIIFLFLSIFYANFYLLFEESEIVFHHSFMKRDLVMHIDDSLRIHLPDEIIMNSKKLRFVINFDKESFLFKIDRETVEVLLGLYPSNIQRYRTLKGVYKQSPRRKRKKIGLFVAAGVAGTAANFLIAAVPIAAIVIYSLGLSANYFEDQKRMTDYAYVCGQFGTLYYDNYILTPKTAFQNYTKDYGDSHGMSDAEMTGSYIVNDHDFYMALSYQEPDGTFGLQIGKCIFANANESFEEVYTETGFASRPFSFSGFDTKIHFYSAGEYLFSYDVALKAKEDCAYTNDQNIADQYYRNHGFSRKSISATNDVLELDNGSISKTVNIQNELPEITKRLKKYSYQAKTVVYLQNNAFIFFDAKNCDYDACLRYDFLEGKITFANAYYDRYGFGFGSQIMIPVLTF